MDNNSFDRCTTETGHSMYGAGDPTLRNRYERRPLKKNQLAARTAQTRIRPWRYDDEAGNSIKKLLLPPCDVAYTRPPCALAMACVIDRPRPAPSLSRWTRALSARKKRSNKRGRISGGMGCPWLDTLMRTAPAIGCSSCVARGKSRETCTL